MKKILTVLLATILLTGCKNNVGDGFDFRIHRDKVSWMNGVIGFQTDLSSNGKKQDNLAFSAYLKCRDGRTIQMPGTDVLGYGASSPMGKSGIYKDNDGYSQAEVLSLTDNRMVIHLKHEPWNIHDEEVSFDKQITLFRDSPIMEVIDYYNGLFELLNVAAGIIYTDATAVWMDNKYVMTYPNGLTAILYMPNQDSNATQYGSALVSKGITPDEPLRYYVGFSDKGAEYLLEELDKIL